MVNYRNILTATSADGKCHDFDKDLKAYGINKLTTIIAPLFNLKISNNATRVIKFKPGSRLLEFEVINKNSSTDY